MREGRIGYEDVGSNNVESESSPPSLLFFNDSRMSTGSLPTLQSHAGNTTTLMMTQFGSRILNDEVP